MTEKLSSTSSSSDGKSFDGKSGKYSFLLRPELAERVQRAASKEGSITQVFVSLVENYLPYELGEAPLPGVPEGAVLLQLHSPVRETVRKVAELYGLDEANFLQMMIVKSLPDFYSRGREHQSSLEKILSENHRPEARQP